MKSWGSMVDVRRCDDWTGSINERLGRRRGGGCALAVTSSGLPCGQCGGPGAAGSADLLGFLAVGSAAQKRVLLRPMAIGRWTPAIRIENDFVPGAEWRYRRAQVIGAYDQDHQFLLDNRVHQGRVWLSCA